MRAVTNCVQPAGVLPFSSTGPDALLGNNGVFKPVILCMYPIAALLPKLAADSKFLSETRGSFNSCMRCRAWQ
jgi:hypothetical protein